jgi:DNA polymerase III sliding clamp (beta) subunit (PCNA family)
MDTKQVYMDFQGELDPCVLRPVDGPDYLGVVMPMRI